MSQISTNPFSFTSADQATTVGITSIASTGYSSLITTSAPHGYTIPFTPISVQGCTTNPLYNNGYKIQSIPSTTTLLVTQNIPNLTANGANGNVLSVAYFFKMRIEQLLWNNMTGVTQLVLTDTNGNLVWSYTPPLANTVYTYGKLFWIDGLVINALPSGTLQATIA